MLGACAKTLLSMARRGEEVLSQTLATFAAAAARIQEQGSNSRAELLGLAELADLLDAEDMGDDGEHPRPG
jgi:hypothetical protein